MRNINKPRVFLPTSLNNKSRTLDSIVSPPTSLNRVVVVRGHNHSELPVEITREDRTPSITYLSKNEYNSSARYDNSTITKVIVTATNNTKTNFVEISDSANVPVDIDTDLLVNTDASVPKSPDMSEMAWPTDLFSDDPYLSQHLGTNGNGPKNSFTDFETTNDDVIGDVMLQDDVTELMKLMRDIEDGHDDVFDMMNFVDSSLESMEPQNTKQANEELLTIDLTDLDSFRMTSLGTNTTTSDLTSSSTSELTSSMTSFQGSTSPAQLPRVIEEHRHSSSSDHDYALKYEYVSPSSSYEFHKLPIVMPTPIVKKKRKRPISETEKEEKYREQRDKNNVASKRSRQSRKQKIVGLANNVSSLSEENARLKEQNAFLEDLAEKTKAYLMECVASK